MTRKLAFFLKPGGVLIVADLIKGEKQTSIAPGIADLLKKQDQHSDPHQKGIDEASMRSVVEGAGLGEFKFSPCIHVVEGEAEANVFIAKGVKPVGE